MRVQAEPVMPVPPRLGNPRGRIDDLWSHSGPQKFMDDGQSGRTRSDHQDLGSPARVALASVHDCFRAEKTRFAPVSARRLASVKPASTRSWIRRLGPPCVPSP